MEQILFFEVVILNRSIMKTFLTIIFLAVFSLAKGADAVVYGNPFTGKSNYTLKEGDTLHLYVTFNKSLTNETISFLFDSPEGGSIIINAALKTYIGKDPNISASNAQYRFIVQFPKSLKSGLYNFSTGINTTLSNNKSKDFTISLSDGTTTSIINPLESDEKITYYTIQGFKVEKPIRGLYIWKSEKGESGKIYIID